MKSQLLYETMDAHGHQLQVDSMACADCRRLAESGGFCEACRIGWHRGEAYFSRLTYEIARATYVEPSSVGCDRCRAHAQSAGWCGNCGRGWIGSFAVVDRGDFEAGRRDHARLLKAVELSERCDYCAMAAVTDTRCFKCKLAYKDGVAVQQQPQ